MMNSIQNIRDLVYSYKFREAYIAANTPKIFSYRQLTNHINGILSKMMSIVGECSDVSEEWKKYCEFLRKDIIDFGGCVDIHDCCARARIGYYLIRSSPVIFMAVYKAERTVRNAINKIKAISVHVES